MDAIRAWSTTLCLAALGCAAVQLLAPKGGTGKLFRLVTNTFFLCCMLLPLLQIGSMTAPNIADLPDVVVSDMLSHTVTEQLRVQVRDTVTRLAEDALAQRGITAEKIVVTTDISDNGGIYIQHVSLMVDKQNVPIAKAVGEVLRKQWEVPVEVTTEGRGD